MSANIYTKNPEFERSLQFISERAFTITIPAEAEDYPRGGTIEYYNKSINKWVPLRNNKEDETIYSGTYPWGKCIYIRGQGNTNISGNNEIITGEQSISGFDEPGGTPWRISVAIPIMCKGNLKYLLDYTTSNRITNAKDRCFCRLFSNTTLQTPPQLPTQSEVEFTNHIFAYLFDGCKNLIRYNYNQSFVPPNGYSLHQSYDGCYRGLFRNCTSLKEAPGPSYGTTPSNVTHSNYFREMFYGCRSLKYPKGANINIHGGEGDYQYTFFQCVSLTDSFGIFRSGSPDKPIQQSVCGATFKNCTNLTKIFLYNESPSQIGQWAFAEMYNGCTKIKLSTRKDDVYTQQYHIPDIQSSNNNAYDEMFVDVDGNAFTPQPQRYYYVDKSIIIQNL